MRKKLTVVVIALSVVLFAVTSFAAPSEQAIQELYQAAKAEGEVVWQVLGADANWKPITNAFEAKFPGIKVKVFGSPATRVPARIITEAAAGKLSMDVGTCSAMDEMLPLLERDLLVSYDWTKISEVKPENILFDGRLIPHHDIPLVWVYNPKLVSEKDMPRSWEELLDPKWKGSKISARSNPTNFSGLFPTWQKDPQKVVRYLEQLRKQQVLPAPGGVIAASRIATGECPIGVIRSALLIVFERKGAPFGICPIGPAVSSPTAFYTVKGVPHPNAAKLLIGWTHTKEAIKVLSDNGRSPAAPCDASPVARLLCKNGLKFISICSTIEEMKQFQKFNVAVNQAMGWK